MTRKLKENVIEVALVVVACVVFYLSTHAALDWRLRVIIGGVLIQAVILAVLVRKIFALLSELRSQHTAATYVNTIRGLVETLRLSAERTDLLPPSTRLAVYQAVEEQFRLYDEALGVWLLK